VIPRAIAFSAFGSPAKVLTVKRLPSLPAPSTLGPSQAIVRFIQSPINPSDINVVQGVYPTKPVLRPEGYYIPGNEGLAQIEHLSPRNTSPLTGGDWVIMRKPQLGTWSSHALLDHSDLLPVPSHAKSSLSTAHLATLAVNPPTALRMLTDFVQLHPGDYFIQNAANSAVGCAAIQIAHAKGIKSINFIRNRPDLHQTFDSLKNLGATHVCTYEELEDEGFRSKVKEWTGNANIRLALNCVGGSVTSRMASLLGHNAHLVSYGAMSKQPLSLSTSHFIFKNLTCHGYWQSRWYRSANLEQINEQMSHLVSLMMKGKLCAPLYEAVVLKGTDSEVQLQISSLMQRVDEAHKGSKSGLKKILLSWE